MRWIEVIQLRTPHSKRVRLEEELAELLEEINRPNHHTSMRVYSREWVETDSCIVLFHDEEKTRIDGSRLGLNLVEVLKAFGMVNHSIWIEGK